MWEAFFTLISYKSAIILIIVVTMVIVWFAASLYHKWTTRIKKTEEECSKIDGIIMPQLTLINTKLNQIFVTLNVIILRLDELTRRVDVLTIRVDNLTKRVDVLTIRVDDLTRRFDSLTIRLDGLTDRFNNLVIFLKEKFTDMDISMYLSKSPIQLSETGLRMLERIGGKEYVDSYEVILIAALNNFNPKTALDVQMYAPDVIFKMAESASFNTIKDFLYNNPYYKETNPEGQEIKIRLSLVTATELMGIYLRDKYLNKYPELRPIEPPLLLN